MLGDWLKRKIQRAGIKGAREDLEGFVESLRELPKERQE
jgi:hypothetical protein